MLTRIGNKVTVGRPLCNVLRIGRPLEGGGSFLRDWTVYGKSEVVGSSVLGVGDVYPWNQLVNVSDGSYTPTSSGNPLSISFQAVEGHKYLCSSQVYAPEGYSGVRLWALLYKGAILGSAETRTFGRWSTLSFIVTVPSSGNTQFQFIRNESPVLLELSWKNVMVFDLTEIFGAGNEPSTVDEFKAWLVKVGKMAKVTDDIPYFPYDAGSTFTSLPIVATGKNLFDMDNNLLVGYYLNATTGAVKQSSDGQSSCFADFLPCKPNTRYTLQKDVPQPISTFLRICVYDVNKTYISTIANSASEVASQVTGMTPANAAYIRCSFGTIGLASTNIMLSEGSTRQEYEPYHGQRFPLVISSPLHGIGDVRDIMRYSLHGITRKYGVVDMGTLNWRMGTVGGHARFSAAVAGIKIPTTSAERLQGILCAIYEPSSSPISGTGIDMTYAKFTDGSIYVYNFAYSAAEAFKAAMSGVMLVYELATPTFEPVALPKLPAYRDGTVLYTDTQVHGDTIAGEAPVGFSLLPPVTMTPPTGDEDTNGQTDDTATE